MNIFKFIIDSINKKAYAKVVSMVEEPMYGVMPDPKIELKRDIVKGGITMSIIILIVGLIALFLNRKSSKKVKVIILVILAIALIARIVLSIYLKNIY